MRSPELDGVTGGSFEQGAEIPYQFRDEDAEERLRGVCQQMVRRPAPR